MSIALNISDNEALQLIKEIEPTCWQVSLFGYMTDLLYHEDEGTSLTKSLQHLVNKTKTMADKILFAAAYQHIMDERVKEYQEVKKKIDAQQQQIIALNSSKLISAKDKGTLHKHYQKSLQSLNARKDQLLKHQSVVASLSVTYEIVSTH